MNLRKEQHAHKQRANQDWAAHRYRRAAVALSAACPARRLAVDEGAVDLEQQTAVATVVACDIQPDRPVLQNLTEVALPRLDCANVELVVCRGVENVDGVTGNAVRADVLRCPLAVDKVV